MSGVSEAKVVATIDVPASHHGRSRPARKYWERLSPARRAVPGGEPQREQAYRLGINLVMYALCLDYKDDHTHVMRLLKRRRGSRRKP